MAALARPLHGVALAIVATASLSGCFTSRTPLVSGADGVKAFGDQGAATRVEFGPNSAPVRVVFAWRGDAYAIADPREPRSQALYRLAPMADNWILTERFDNGVAVYGLARRDGDRLWTYSPACQDLSDAERDTLNVTIRPDGFCWLTSAEQLKSAMRKLSSRALPPDGYFELVRK